MVLKTSLIDYIDDTKLLFLFTGIRKNLKLLCFTIIMIEACYSLLLVDATSHNREQFMNPNNKKVQKNEIKQISNEPNAKVHSIDSGKSRRQITCKACDSARK